VITEPVPLARALGDWARGEGPPPRMLPPEPDPLEQRRIDVIDQAADRCDRLFPPRYRAALLGDAPAVAEWVVRYHDDPTDCPNLLLLGPTGVGKTHQAYAALRAAVCHPRPATGNARGVGYRADAWKADTFADLLASLRPRNGVDTEQALKELREVPLLLVDDLGVAKNSEWVEDVTYRLLNGRYNDMRPSIFTSNLAVDQLRDAVGDRIASRLAESSIRVVLAGADRRRARPA
jgi:DNA replication protein DnaC